MCVRMNFLAVGLCIEKSTGLLYYYMKLSQRMVVKDFVEKMNEEYNVPPTIFQRLDSGVRTRGSEIKARGTEMEKKAGKEEKTESN